jgi:hypothetical protein
MKFQRFAVYRQERVDYFLAVRYIFPWIRFKRTAGRPPRLPPRKGWRGQPENSKKKEIAMKMYGHHAHEEDEDFFGSNLGAGIDALDGVKDEFNEDEEEDGFAVDEDDGIVLADTDGFDIHEKDDMHPAGAPGGED